MPDAVRYLADWHTELQQARRWTEHGMDPLSFAELDAWARLTGRTPDALEVEALMQMDLAARHPGTDA
jgi:hypothetical protein